MIAGKTLLERAFELARSGEAMGIVDIKTRLNAEGYIGINAHLDGGQIRTELRRAMGRTVGRKPSLDEV